MKTLMATEKLQYKRLVQMRDQAAALNGQLPATAWEFNINLKSKVDQLPNLVSQQQSLKGAARELESRSRSRATA